MKWHITSSPCKGDYRCSIKDFSHRLSSEQCKRCTVRFRVSIRKHLLSELRKECANTPIEDLI